jgi:hypothetical protein
VNYLHQLATNRDPPNFCLLSSEDYRHEPRGPARGAGRPSEGHQANWGGTVGGPCFPFWDVISSSIMTPSTMRPFLITVGPLISDFQPPKP